MMYEREIYIVDKYDLTKEKYVGYVCAEIIKDGNTAYVVVDEQGKSTVVMPSEIVRVGEGQQRTLAEVAVPAQSTNKMFGIPDIFSFVIYDYQEQQYLWLIMQQIAWTSKKEEATLLTENTATLLFNQLDSIGKGFIKIENINNLK